MSAKAWVIFVKELTDNLRDRRSWSKVLVFALMGPLMMAVVAKFITKERAGDGSEVVELPVLGAERAPGLMGHLAQRHFRVVPAPPDPEAAVRSGKPDLVLVIPPDFVPAFEEARPAPVQIVVDQSRAKISIVRRLQDALREHSSGIGAYRLWARGTDPRIVAALAVETVNTEPPLARIRPVLLMVPMFLLFSVFLGGLYVAIDVTAGERERGSLEQLLLNPVSPADVVLGKLGAVLASIAVTTLLTALGYHAVFNAGLLDVPGVRLGLSPAGLLRVLLAMLPVVLLAGALLMLLASRSATFKEANTNAQLLLMLPMAPGMLATFMPRMEQPMWAAAVPIYSQQLQISQMLQGSPVPIGEQLVAAATTLLAGVALTVITIRRYDRERVLLGQ